MNCALRHGKNQYIPLTNSIFYTSFESFQPTDPFLRFIMSETDLSHDWYFQVHRPDESSEAPLFRIVHRRYWHRHHAFVDSYIANYVPLPQGFAEVGESTFQFDGYIAEGEQRLLSYGFQKLELPNMWGVLLVVHTPTIASKPTRMDIICDTPELKVLLQQHLASLALHAKRSFTDLDSFRSWVETCAPHVIFGYGSHPSQAYFMEKVVDASLHAYPKNWNPNYL